MRKKRGEGQGIKEIQRVRLQHRLRGRELRRNADEAWGTERYMEDKKGKSIVNERGEFEKVKRKVSRNISS